MTNFARVRKFYASTGRQPCSRFGGYHRDANSLFMTLNLDKEDDRET